VQKFNHHNENEGVYVGIDFGTANCSISIANSNICNTLELEDGLRVPSIVYFNKSIIIGTEAKKYIGSKNTIFGIKQLLGRTVNAAFKEHIKHLPFTVDTQFERAKIVIDNGGITDRFNVEDIAAFILMKQKMSTELFLNRALDTVSITVPA
ncbi:heat shock protein-like protein, partial [Leptotrombidium deliense]